VNEGVESLYGISISDVEEATRCVKVSDVVLRMERGGRRFDVRVLVGMRAPECGLGRTKKNLSEPRRSASRELVVTSLFSRPKAHCNRSG
jgi:hypothetical protein